MPPAPDDTHGRVFRQMLGALAGGFITGFLVVAALFTYAIVRYVWPEDRWWALPHLLQGLFVAATAGMWSAWAAMTLVARRQHRLGMHRCFTCNRVLAYGYEPCVCDVEGRARYRRRQRLPNRTLRHYRKRLPAMLIVNLLVLPVAWYGVTRPWHPRTDAVALEVIFLQALLCILVAALLHLVESFAGLLKRGRRLRPRIALFTQMLILWPIVCLIVAAICAAMPG